MTPAVMAVKKAKIHYDLLEYSHDTAAESYGLEAAEKLALDAGSVFKTLLVSLTGHRSNLAVAVLPVTHSLSLKAMAKALGAKKAEMADPVIAERSTGYVVGGISPLGQKKSLPTVIDTTAQLLPLVHISAGRRGLEIALTAKDLATLSRGIFAQITAE